MATTAPSWTPLINWIEGSSTSASKIGKSPVEGLKKMNSTPAALSCCTNSAPPVPCTSRIADAGAAAESDCAIAFTATELIPSADRPVMSLRREIPLSRYCLIRSFIEASSQGGCCDVYPLDQTASVAPSLRLQKPTEAAGRCSDRARRNVHREREQRGVEDEGRDSVAEHGTADRLATHGHVRHLRAHADHEREIHEIPIVRLGLVAGKLHAATLAVILVVILMRVVQREDRVRECPRQEDRDGGEEEVGGAAHASAGAAEQREDGDQARECGDRSQNQDSKLAFILQSRPSAHAMDVGLGHRMECEHEIKPGADVPADEQ